MSNNIGTLRIKGLMDALIYVRLIARGAKLKNQSECFKGNNEKVGKS